MAKNKLFLKMRIFTDIISKKEEHISADPPQFF